jgi:biopolymer transport protein ExbB
MTFFEQFVVAGGPIVWFVLLPMSLLTVFFVMEQILILRRKKILPENVGGEISAAIRNDGIAALRKEVKIRHDIVSSAFGEVIDKGKAGDLSLMQAGVAESLQEQGMRLLRKVEWLHMIGNVSPMVGLFGTVFGMIKLFNAIVVAGGQPQPAKLAGGISVALVTTFWGLFIAIPALAVHGFFRNRIESLVSEAAAEADEVIAEVRRNVAKQKRPSRAGASQQPIKDLGRSGQKKPDSSVSLG